MLIAGGHDPRRAMPLDAMLLWDIEVNGRIAGSWSTSYHKGHTL
jgi:hypothetical protein